MGVEMKKSLVGWIDKRDMEYFSFLRQARAGQSYPPNIWKNKKLCVGWNDYSKNNKDFIKVRITIQELK